MVVVVVEVVVVVVRNEKFAVFIKPFFVGWEGKLSNFDSAEGRMLWGTRN